MADQANIQALVDAAVAERVDAAVAAVILAMGQPPAGGLPAGGVVAPEALAYACNPAQAITGLLNYKSAEGMKIYNAAIAALPTKYSGNTIDMHIFLKRGKARW